jgi:hypothetical protein
VDVADGGGPALPEDVKNLEFGGGGLLRVRHVREVSTKEFVLSTKFFVVGENISAGTAKDRRTSDIAWIFDLAEMGRSGAAPVHRDHEL